MTSPITARIEAPDQVRSGIHVPVMLFLVNTGHSPVELHLLGREIVYDLTVSNAGGRVVWRRLAGETTQAVLRLEELAPAEVLEIRGSWDGVDSSGKPVDPGLYAMRGAFPTDAEPIETNVVEIRIHE